MTTIDDCRVIDLKKIHRREGNITPAESGVDVPFDIERVYYLYDVPGGESRGGHAHFELQQLLVSTMGSFDVVIDDGERRKTVNLNRAYRGLLIPSMIWREIVNFSSGGICLVLASHIYEEADYIRDYPMFRNQKHRILELRP
ncbi:MAG TPA: FdtA/QdtA family cupin domain-containing protein [Polyangiaceae bacterium]|nr:FdtA/QdtA family cupin domain-containing protein [Polyangiaceae bacterium]